MATNTVKEKKTRFNLIDLVIIIVVIACIIGTVFRAAIIEKLSFVANNDTAYVTFYAENLTAEDVASISVGDEFSLNGKSFGVIEKSPESNSQSVVVPSQDGSGFYCANDDKLYTVKGEMKIRGDSTENGFFFGSDTHIGVGKVLSLEGKKCNISIVITKITENEA